MIRIPSRRDVLKTGSALALGTALGARGAHARDITAREKELYELAKKEGEVTWYTAHSNDTTAQALGRDFEAAFPGIKANVVRTTAQVAYQRLTQEQQGRRDAGRRVLLDRHRPLRGAEGKEPAREIRAGQRQQADRGLQELRSGRVSSPSPPRA